MPGPAHWDQSPAAIPDVTAVPSLRLSWSVYPHPLLFLPDRIFEPWVLLRIIDVHVEVRGKDCRGLRSS